MVFSNDTCYYQSINIYCSICADSYINGIMKDGFYGFRAEDKVNYVSKNKKVILRLKESIQDNGNCNKITIHSMDQHSR